MNEWYTCEYDGEEFNLKFTVVGTYIGDKGEHIDKDRVLDVWRMTDKNTAWEELANGKFEFIEGDEE